MYILYKPINYKDLQRKFIEFHFIALSFLCSHNLAAALSQLGPKANFGRSSRLSRPGRLIWGCGKNVAKIWGTLKFPILGVIFVCQLGKWVSYLGFLLI